MKSGTKTILFGTHQFFIHPIFVFMAWLILYKRLPNRYEFLAILTHDLGYWGLPNIDGEEGEEHPAIVYDFWMNFLRPKNGLTATWRAIISEEVIGHSRFYSNKTDFPLSKLFYADKLSVTLYPSWFYLLLANLSGEIKEYMKLSDNGKYDWKDHQGSQIRWWLETKSVLTLMALGKLGDSQTKIEKNLNDPH